MKKITVSVFDKHSVPSFIESVDFDSIESAEVFADKYRDSDYHATVAVR